MKLPSLSSLSSDELVERFVALSVAQGHALSGDDVPTANRLYGQIEAVKQELQRRDGDQRRKLVALYQHQDMHVRLNAARSTLALAPQGARLALETIAASGWQPQALHAGMSLWALDKGIFKPT